MVNNIQITDADADADDADADDEKRKKNQPEQVLLSIPNNGSLNLIRGSSSDRFKSRFKTRVLLSR